MEHQKAYDLGAWQANTYVSKFFDQKFQLPKKNLYGRPQNVDMTPIWEKIIQKRSKNVLFPSKTLENDFSALRRSWELRFGHDRGRGRSSNILGLTICYRYDFMILYATGTIF